ncbi:alpha/beta fold hydrolase [Amycolatopsis sp. H20-H5]|uniref:alpha/beta fold hydrolase n=1 Tax=Amycolatopsis sp. H20-H5 TaxID=3046309 RepID=UPI002DB6205A|nr:alpha/beta hydrolase [Amycolatopsis sp. H20-H5]MEC3978509.1 alpha/beta hydrolase [Amycolatopsis sp. H20-H5]
MKAIGDFRSPARRNRYFDAYDKAMDECPAPAEVYDVATRHGTTRVYRFGQGDVPPMVLLPGLMATAACYWSLIPAFAAHGPVYAVDTLGEAGRSVQTSPFEDLADRARCLDDVLERLDLTEAHLVGGSTGGWHAFNQAIHAPVRLASVTMLDPTTLTAPFSRPVLWYSALTAILDNDWMWRRFLRWSAGEDIMGRPDAQLTLAGIRAYRSRVPFQSCPGDDEIRSVRTPVLAMFGARSVVHDPIVAADRLRALLPHADIETLPGAGHHLFLRPADRDRIVDRVLEFTKRTSLDRT